MLLQQQQTVVERERMLNSTVSRMRETLEQQQIFNTVLQDTRAILAADRTVIYLFNELWEGTIVAESVNDDYLAALGAQIADPCFADTYVEKYRKGRVQATTDIRQAGLTECHIKQLEAFQIKANLVAPILVKGKLLGLLIAHQCSAPRQWQEADIRFMRQIAIQLGFALEQASLLNTQTRSADRSRMLNDIVASMRRSLETEEILNITVSELRYALHTDRVIVYRFQDDWNGTIIAESVTAGWRKILGETVNDPFQEGLIERYRNGRVRAIHDIYAEGLTDCHRDILEDFQIRASVVAPILQNGQLIGLLCAHQCSQPRNWEEEEIGLFTQLAIQLGFALEQAGLFDQKEQARLAAEALSEARQQQQQYLQQQLVDLLVHVEGAALGDLTVRADVTSGEIGTVADFFNAIIESLRQIVTQVKQSAVQVNLALGQNEDAVHRLAQDAFRQAEETSHTLTSVEQMTSSIQTVADNARQAAHVARTAFITAETGGMAMDMTVHNILSLRETIGDTTKKVKRLGESSQQISRVVSLINQIALQTNLLAINAGVEAARAGEEGQGFAIVAEEVGELAARSSEATQEIEKVVATIQRETNQVVEAMEHSTVQVVEGTRLVEEAKHSLYQILEVSRQIDGLVQSISDATVSQVATSEAVSHLMQQVTHVSEQTSQSSQQVAAAIQQTVSIAQELQDSVGAFKVEPS
jgi:methyl-accepting chemotaxis protein